MDAHAAAFRYAILPTTCPKCRAAGPALTYDSRSMSCVMCGKVCYLAPEEDREPLPLETDAERGQRYVAAGRARVRKMTPQQIKTQMDRVRKARRSTRDEDDLSLEHP